MGNIIVNNTPKKESYKTGYLYNLLCVIDCLFNALSAGNYQCMISSRVGRFYLISKSKYWDILRCIIDSTFYPLDGKNHCVDSYLINNDEEFNRGNDIALVILAIFVVILCIPIAILTWSLYGIKTLVKLFK